MTSADRIKLLREQLGISQAELARRIGVARSAISMYESGTRAPTSEMYENLADFFNVDVDYLMARTEKTTVLPERIAYELRTNPYKAKIDATLRRLNNEGQEKVAIYADDLDKSGQYRANRSVDMSDYVETYSVASAAAGAGAYNEGHEEFYRRVSACDIPERFDAQIDITGDSMEPTIPDGAVAFVEFTLGDPPKDGEIYVFQRGEDTMIKRGFFEKDHWTLCSDNPEHEDITVTESDSVRIIGRLVDWTLPV